MYEYSTLKSPIANLLRRLTHLITGIKIEPASASQKPISRRINIAIVGAGRVGVMLADELMKNPSAAYQPCCFIEIDNEKIGRYINGLPVLAETEATTEKLATFPIQEIVFAMPEVDSEHKQRLYTQYKQTGCKIKVYDYPDPQKMGSKRTLRDFDITELLFRQQVEFMDEHTRQYYHGKTVLISGGGGSIGSELCRQIAKLEPKRLVILDVYENGAYDIQQELRIRYGEKLDLVVEIATVCDREALERIFEEHRPDVVLHAAAHKHVPLMERNCVEAVKNNVFGTLNIVEVSEKYEVGKFTMISTDKAVNPTNVMGATKRMCEMIVQSRTGTKTNFSATRFGNVLGSNGS
ncbi:MAG: polysaccharide biosynthesis protein, partial [Clostridia bacterium]|nr:polysaccharide biosynthesis protein [Clostridia bacterium]